MEETPAYKQGANWRLGISLGLVNLIALTVFGKVLLILDGESVPDPAFAAIVRGHINANVLAAAVGYMVVPTVWALFCIALAMPERKRDGRRLFWLVVWVGVVSWLGWIITAPM